MSLLAYVITLLAGIIVGYVAKSISSLSKNSSLTLMRAEQAKIAAWRVSFNECCGKHVTHSEECEASDEGK